VILGDYFFAPPGVDLYCQM